MPPATPTQSVYLHAGDGPVDAAVWPPSGFQTPPSSVEGQPVPSEPLYYFAGDTIEPQTTNGASVPDWGLYTGPTEPVAAQGATTVAEPTGQAAAEAQAAAAQQASADPSQAQTTAPTGGEPAAPSAPTSEQTPSASGSGEADASAAATAPSSQDASATAAAMPAAPEAPEAPVGADSASEAGAAPETAASGAQTVPADSGPVASTPRGVVNGVVYTPRTDDDVLSGCFCRVIRGEHQGRYGVLIGAVTVNVGDGWPAVVTVRTRDDRDEYIEVNYDDIRPAQPGGR